jgi:hypothetical protein
MAQTNLHVAVTIAYAVIGGVMRIEWMLAWEDSMNRRTIIVGIGGAVGAFVGAVITNVSHFTGYLPYLIIGIAAAAGVIVVPLIFDRK